MPDMRGLTSRRGRPSSDRGITSRPLTLPEPFCHTGFRPISQRISATSSPLERIVGLPQRMMPMVSG